MFKIGVAVLITTTICIHASNGYTPPFLHKWKNFDLNFNVYHNIHPSPATRIATKPVRRDKNHEMINEKSYALSIDTFTSLTTYTNYILKII